MGFAGWIAEITGFALLRFLQVFGQLALPLRPSRDVTPETEFPDDQKRADYDCDLCRFDFVAVDRDHVALWFIIVPRIMGAPIMLLFTLTACGLMENSRQSWKARDPFAVL